MRRSAEKILTAIAILASMAIIAILGFVVGKDHVIENGTFYIVDYEQPDGGEYDLTLYIEIDGDVYERGMYVC